MKLVRLLELVKLVESEGLLMTKVGEGREGVGALVGFLPQANRLQHRHHHVVLIFHIF